MPEESESGGEGEHERAVLHEDDRAEAAPRRQLPGLAAAPRREQDSLRGQSGRHPDDEAGDVSDLEERVGQGRFRSSLRRGGRS